MTSIDNGLTAGGLGRRHPRLSRLLLGAAACGLLVTLAACSDDKATDAKSQPATDTTTTPSSADTSASVASATPGPELAYADVQLVASIGEWTREPIDDSVDAKLETAYVDSSNTAVVVDVSDYVNGGAGFEPGFVPAYWDNASDRTTYDDGLTCGVLDTGSGCYRLLSDGILEFRCNDGPCSMTPDDLDQVAGMFYQAFSGGSTSEGMTDEQEACAGVDTAAIDAALQPWLNGGQSQLNLDESVAGESYTCYVELPAGSFGTAPSDSAPEIVVLRHPYSSATQMSSGDCDFGGSTPDEVFSSAVSCKQQIDATDDYAQGVKSVPAADGGGAVVSQGEVVQATSGNYWWQVTLTNVTFNADYFENLLKTADSLP